MAGCIFINYRREISAAAAGRLSDRLAHHFYREHLFMDVEGIEPGIDFVKALDDQVAQCSVFIAVIGSGWSDVRNSAGQRRLDQSHDHVRIEIESALKRDIRVIPVLVDGARMPTPNELPKSLRPLVRRNAMTISHHRFGAEVDELARVLKRVSGLSPKPTKRSLTSAWPDYLFSFEGRISRKSFWLSGLLLVAVCAVIYSALAGLLAMTLFGAEVFAQGQSSYVLNMVYNIAILPSLWPSFALYVKRVHDFGGRMRWWIWPPAILLILFFVFDFADNQLAAGITILLASGIWLVVGCIKGTQGPNEYGPDTLGPSLEKSVI